MVAVRSTGYSFDSIIGHQHESGQNIALVDEQYLRTLVTIANDRFRINTERISRFRTALMELFQPQSTGSNSADGKEWEDADARRQRKREEGLARRRALQAEAPEAQSPVRDEQTGMDFDNHMFQ
jgi:tRNA wybutosine-synthesizing protein 3